MKQVETTTTTTTTADGQTITTTTTTYFDEANATDECGKPLKGGGEQEAQIEREADEAASAAITTFMNEGTANGPEMTFKLFGINTSTPTHAQSNWCGPLWRKDCAWGYVLLILALVYAGFGGYFGFQVHILLCLIQSDN